VHVELNRKSDTSNNRGKLNHVIFIQTVLQLHARKAQHAVSTANSHI